MKKERVLIFVICACVWAFLGTLFPPVLAAKHYNDLVLATTTSTKDTDLLDYLLTVFGKQTNIKVKVISVGSGQAFQLGQMGTVMCFSCTPARRKTNSSPTAGALIAGMSCTTILSWWDRRKTRRGSRVCRCWTQ